MRVKVRLKGFPELLPPFADQEEVPVNFPGNSVHDLIHHLMSKIGGKTKGVLLNEEGGISPDLAITVNGWIFTESNRLNQRLEEGDSVELILAPE